jgi:hypothetical protein
MNIVKAKNNEIKDLQNEILLYLQSKFLYSIPSPFFSLPLFFLFSWILRRYTSQMISISIPWAAFGCLEVTGWLHRWIEKEPLRKRVSIILSLFLLGGFSSREG